ncbi:short-chain fatty acyl-CoA regulator family protein [Nocardiopsis ansamitocini]|uniref:XRE family transcriptional regulator n=1 Tax=Nocardiopsis ansamitocini TaxID=1670832 RepID=A0A9W6P837_9ACTN|nr:short-chain fatty acyl-CoA regulator family protein [Nocardiopsis ansamitocini]GLU48748.1 XRE family transcriptional regulator [Nocardiopsis ansamitocini]
MRKVFAGARLRRLRQDRSLTQADLARDLGISASYLNQIEHNQRPLSVPVLLRITEVFGVEPGFFAEADTTRLIAELREVMAEEPAGEQVTPDELDELASALPSVARTLVALHRRYRDAAGQAAALAEGRDAVAVPGTPMAYEQVRDFFYERQNYVGELDERAEDAAIHEDAPPGQARDVLVRRLDRLHGVRTVIGAPGGSGAAAPRHRAYDPATRVITLAAHLRPGQQAFQLATQLAFLEHGPLLSELARGEQLRTEQAVRLARIGLANYFAGAFILPYRAFRSAAEAERYDIELLADAFDVGFETVCHRLSTLQRPRLRGVPFSFVRVDRAGNMSKRQSATGFHFSRSGGTCPLWNVYAAFAAPGVVQTQIAQMPDGRSYFWVARTVGRNHGGYGAAGKTFAVGLGCELRHAHRLVYSTGLDLADPRAATPIGMGCKVCERPACPQRAFPPAGRALLVNENTSTVSPYPVAGGPER